MELYSSIIEREIGKHYGNNISNNNRNTRSDAMMIIPIKRDNMQISMTTTTTTTTTTMAKTDHSQPTWIFAQDLKKIDEVVQRKIAEQQKCASKQNLVIRRPQPISPRHFLSQSYRHTSSNQHDVIVIDDDDEIQQQSTDHLHRRSISSSYDDEQLKILNRQGLLRRQLHKAKQLAEMLRHQNRRQAADSTFTRMPILQKITIGGSLKHMTVAAMMSTIANNNQSSSASVKNTNNNTGYTIRKAPNPLYPSSID